MVAASKKEENSIPGEPVLITFGSNIDPLNHLWHGLRHLHQEVGVQAVSTVYRSTALANPAKPQPVSDGPAFLNGAVQLARRVEPRPLRQLLRKIEQDQKRVRSSDKYAPRTLDLDIAMMGEQLFLDDPLTIPDPDIIHRPFLALPLAELAATLFHPQEKIPLGEIAARFGKHPAGLHIDEQATQKLQSIIQP